MRRSIDRVRSLVAVREEYAGHWLPEPVSTDRLPEDAVADRELLSLTLLHLAEQLSPEARAAVVLHRAYGMTAVEIGEIIEKSPAAVRQLISRAERRLQIDEHSAAPHPADPEALSRLLTAVQNGDLDTLLSLLTDESILWTDGGGVVAATRNPIFGAEKVHRFYLGVREKAQAYDPDLPFSISPIEVNGEFALSLSHSGRVDVLTLEFDRTGMIRGIRQVCNPHKLTRAFSQQPA